jgi:hypothetical protein
VAAAAVKAYFDPEAGPEAAEGLDGDEGDEPGIDPASATALGG